MHRTDIGKNFVAANVVFFNRMYDGLIDSIRRSTKYFNVIQMGHVDLADMKPWICNFPKFTLRTRRKVACIRVLRHMRRYSSLKTNLNVHLVRAEQKSRNATTTQLEKEKCYNSASGN